MSSDPKEKKDITENLIYETDTQTHTEAIDAKLLFNARKKARRFKRSRSKILLFLLFFILTILLLGELGMHLGYLDAGVLNIFFNNNGSSIQEN